MEVVVPLLDRWLRRTTAPVPLTPEDVLSYPATSPLRVLRADGQRIDLTARDAGTRIAMIRQEWQADAWQYRDMIGELRYAQRLLARSVSTVRFFAAEMRAYPDNPVELTGTEHKLDPQLAKDAVANLARLPLDDGPDGFVATFTENIETAGEAWIHGEPDEGDGERWSIRSVSEIMGAGDQILLAELPSLTTMGQRVITKNEELLRCWTRHPRWGQLADSPLRAMLDVLEEVVLTGREMRAAARSRIASNGVLLIPTTLSLLRTREDEEALLDQCDVDDDFMADFTEALTAPIRNEGSPGSVVPLVLRGDAEALKEVRHLSLTRDDAAKLMDRLQGALLRMLQGLDIQPEQVTGLGTANHWSGWQVEASNIRHQVLPTCGIVAGCLTKAFLRPALRAIGHPADQVRRVAVWYDPTSLVESPDRAQDARDAWDRDAISNEALREALGFDDEHAPEPHEHLARMLSRGRLTPQAVPLVAALSGVDLRDAEIQQALAIAVGLNPPRTAAGRTGTQPPGLPAGQQSTANPAQPSQVVPEKVAPTPPTPEGSPPPPGVTAAGQRAESSDETLPQLAAIDASLFERILVAADAAIARAVERAEGRIRNAVRKDKALTASIEGAGSLRVAATLGRDTVTSLVSMPDLLVGAYQRLENQFDRWLTFASKDIADMAPRLVGTDPDSPRGWQVRDAVSEQLALHRRAAWEALTAAMDNAAERALFSQYELAADSLISLRDIARVLSIAGGCSPSSSDHTGFATGSAVRDAISKQGATYG
jgi:hypothetical protein